MRRLGSGVLFSARFQIFSRGLISGVGNIQWRKLSRETIYNQTMYKIFGGLVNTGAVSQGPTLKPPQGTTKDEALPASQEVAEILLKPRIILSHLILHDLLQLA